MAGTSKTIRFRNGEAFTGLTGIVDFDKCVVHGVSLITGQMEAEGHDLMVDETTTSQLYKLAKAAGQVPVYLDHGSGIKELNGYIDQFRMDGTKVRGDWNLLTKHNETQVMLERADRQPKTFGLSVSFKGSGVSVPGGKKAARATKLLSADVVPRPAANKEGLFGVRDSDPVDTAKKVMSKTGQAGSEQAEAPTLDDVMAAIGKLGTRMETIEQGQTQMREDLDSAIAGDGGSDTSDADYATLTALNKMTDAELAEKGITRDEVNAAVDQWNTGIDAQGSEAGDEGGEPVAGSGEQVAEGALAGAASGVESSTAMQVKELTKTVTRLAATIRAKEVREQNEQDSIQFEAIKSGIVELEDTCIQLSEQSGKLSAENEALRLAFRTGTRPVKAGIESDRLFTFNEEGELHPFQKRVKEMMETKKMTKGQAIQFASNESPNLHMEWIEAGANDRLIRG